MTGTAIAARKKQSGTDGAGRFEWRAESQGDCSIGELEHRGVGASGSWGIGELEQQGVGADINGIPPSARIIMDARSYTSQPDPFKQQLLSLQNNIYEFLPFHTFSKFKSLSHALERCVYQPKRRRNKHKIREKEKRDYQKGEFPPSLGIGVWCVRTRVAHRCG